MGSARARILAPYLFVSLVMVAPAACAYLDPSTGSMILSAIVGMFATAALAIRTYWYKLKNLLRRRRPGEGDATPGDAAAAPGRDAGPGSKAASD